MNRIFLTSITKILFFYTSLPFKFGDLIVKTNDEIGWAMINRYEDLLAEEVLSLTEKFSSD